MFLTAKECTEETVDATSEDIAITPSGNRDVLDSSTTPKTFITMGYGDTLLVQILGSNVEIMNIRFVAKYATSIDVFYMEPTDPSETINVSIGNMPLFIWFRHCYS